LWHKEFGNERIASSQDLMKGSYLGPYFSKKEIIITNKRYKAVYNYYESFDQLSKKVSHLISKGNIVGWFQGRSEFGPRALGNRSILADPRNENMKDIINMKIKRRENFRPFAPAVLEEDVHDQFEIEVKSP